jgi:hypothetical protein
LRQVYSASDYAQRSKGEDGPRGGGEAERGVEVPAFEEAVVVFEEVGLQCINVVRCFEPKLP